MRQMHWVKQDYLVLVLVQVLQSKEEENEVRAAEKALKKMVLLDALEVIKGYKSKQ